MSSAFTIPPSQSHSSGEYCEQTVFSVVYSGGMIGSSYYTSATLAIRMTRELPDSGPNLRQLEQLLNSVQPTTILVSRTAHRDLANVVHTFAAFYKDTQVEKVPSQYMKLPMAKQELLNLNLQGQPDASFIDWSLEDKMIYIKSVIDFSQEVSLKSMGALLQHVKARFQTVDSSVIGSLRMHRGCDHLSISSRTLRDLHIVSEVSHPCYWQGDAFQTKEGLSVFSLFEKHCTIGRIRLKSMFAAPLNNLSQIRDRLDSVEYFVSQPHLSECLRQSIANIRRVDRILVNMCKGETTVPEWQTIRDVCHELLVIREQLSSAPRASSCSAIQDASEVSLHDLDAVLQMIDQTVDFEAYKENISFSCPVKAGVCVHLDEKKKQLFGEVNAKLRELSLTEMIRMPSAVSNGRIIYIPCWGFVFSTSLENEKAVLQLNVEKVCTMDTEIFFRTQITRELNEIYGDIRNIIIHREGQIMRTLQREVLRKSWQLLKVIDKLCSLDSILALATTARERAFSRPEVTDQRIIAVKNGYHPLLELTKPQGAAHIQSNSFISHESPFVHIITGANSCGKSVYMRQNAVIVFLAHVGSFVPAEQSKIGLLDTIQSSFFIDGSMQDEASTFALQCRLIATIERDIESSRALIVIDEFGKATNTAEGTGLCVALVQRLVMHPHKPHVLMASHYCKNLHFFLKHCPEVQFQTFRYLIEQGNLVQLHKVVRGLSVKSFSDFIADEANLPPEMIKMQQNISKGFEQHRIFEDYSTNHREHLNFVIQAIEDTQNNLKHQSDKGTPKSKLSAA